MVFENPISGLRNYKCGVVELVVFGKNYRVLLMGFSSNYVHQKTSDQKTSVQHNYLQVATVRVA